MSGYYICDSCDHELSGYSKKDLLTDGWRWEDAGNGRMLALCGPCIELYEQRRQTRLLGTDYKPTGIVPVASAQVDLPATPPPTFIERIAGAWLDAAAHADQQAHDLMRSNDLEATEQAIHWDTTRKLAENQASLVTDLASLRVPA